MAALDPPRRSGEPSLVALSTLPWLFWAKQLVQKSNRPHTALPKPETVPEKNQPAIFRIFGIPHNWDSKRLGEALQTIDPELDLKRAEVSGLFPASFDSTQTALLNLSECTSYFTFEKKTEVIDKNGQKVYLDFDKHFYDLTPLNRPEEPIKMELVIPQKGAF